MRKPTQHVVMSFVSADDATAAVLLLHQLGLASTDIASYTSAQMRARAAAVLGRVCPPTPPGGASAGDHSTRTGPLRPQFRAGALQQPAAAAAHLQDRRRNVRPRRADLVEPGRAGTARAPAYCQLSADRSLANSGTSFHSPLSRALATVIQVGWYR